MRIFLCLIFLCCFKPAFAQDMYSSDADYTASYNYSEKNYKRNYPYAKGYSPFFLGFVGGYNFLKAREIEAGLALNFYEGLTDFGMTTGYQLIYKRSLEREQNAIDLELGVYGVISMGIGVNYTFSNDVSAFGFKPFIGTSIYHFQLLYGYNCIRKKKQEWYQLSRHSLSIRYVIPLKANNDTYYDLPPAPNYRNLPGLHKNHPVKDPIYQKNRQYRY